MSYPRLLVVTSCTGQKRFKPENQLRLDDFKNLDLLQSRSAELAEYACPAGQMYTGVQHLRLMEAVAILRKIFGTEAVDVAILSAAYGLIGEADKIVPYEVTFNKMKVEELEQWTTELKVHSSFEKKIQNYDLIFVLLGEKYLRSLKLPVQTRENQTIIFLTSKGSLNYLKISQAKSFAFLLSNLEAKYYGYGLVGLKGFLFKRFAEIVVHKSTTLTMIYSEPQLFTKVIDNQPIQLDLPLEVSSGNSKQVFLSPPTLIDLKSYQYNSVKLGRSETQDSISLPDIEPAINYHLGMQYFIPEWDDHVDPKYDFIEDFLTPNRDPHDDEVYAHQIYSSPIYDGILVSRTVFNKSKKKSEIILAEGIHKYIRFPDRIMGDCGAFGYIEQEKPPYKTAEILDYYQKVGFNYGVSIDHLIVGKFAKPGIREKRYHLTLNNAEEFIQKHLRGGYRFTPIGAVQGWSPESYANAVKACIEMGYEYIGLGGLARAKTQEILEILHAINPHLTAKTKIHLFGVGRLNAVQIFRYLGVTSFDSASPLRKAWLDPIANYHTITGKTYAAVRIPKANSTRIKSIVKAGVASMEIIQQLEKQSLSSLRKFDKGQLTLDETLDALLAYDRMLELPRDGKVNATQAARRVKKHAQMYRVLLEDRPWKDCNCEICSSIGVEVVIFRGNDRNRRRGFHNTYVFYKRFQQLLNNLILSVYE